MKPAETPYPTLEAIIDTELARIFCMRHRRRRLNKAIRRSKRLFDNTQL